ncbi:MAG: GNAT family N-acetyltransferase [Chloroflexi bacterium]|nr:GNAT family N-acetyltransferase [Chloroflexota bacterium]MBU1750933.1 GNAT family N-acetyltransferase [Chloroflexota bacterium]MBU1878156.1 GNAT family N-acetyltransferase [Chloroflexota bacterium]
MSVTIIRPETAHELTELVRAIASAETPADPQVPDRAVAGLRQALARHDVTGSDWFWVLVARASGELAGYVAVCRIPKLDVRAGFLFVDEVYVLPAYRRHGVGAALLEAAAQLAGELGLAGVRLLARPENAAARRLYRSLGFVEHETMFYEKRVEPA